MNDEHPAYRKPCVDSRVIAVLVLLARRNGDAKSRKRFARQRCRLESTHGAARTARRESIPVLARRLQAAGLSVYGVSPLGSRVLGALLNHVTQAIVRRDFPVHRHDGIARHAAARLHRRRCEARPQHHGIRRRETGCDAQRERIARESDSTCRKHFVLRQRLALAIAIESARKERRDLSAWRVRSFSVSSAAANPRASPVSSGRR